MNPFKDIVAEDRLRDNRDSPFYSRYEFVFNQVTPFREPLYNSVKLKLKNDQEAVDLALFIYNKLPGHIHSIIKLLRHSAVREKQDFLGEDEYFLEFYMVADKVNIAVENIYFSIYMLADVVEDCHFFMYSSDADTRWIDEYKITDGKLFFNRDISDADDYTWYLDYYISRAIKEPALTQFAIYQLADLLAFRIEKYKYTMERLSTIDLVQQTDIEESLKRFFSAMYSLDNTCTDWYSLNEKYKLDKII